LLPFVCPCKKRKITMMMIYEKKKKTEENSKNNDLWKNSSDFYVWISIENRSKFFFFYFSLNIRLHEGIRKQMIIRWQRTD
jgi:hypothetical protein